MAAFDVGSPMSQDMNIRTIEAEERAAPSLQGTITQSSKRNHHLLQSGHTHRRGKLPLLKRSPFTIEIEKSRHLERRNRLLQLSQPMHHSNVVSSGHLNIDQQ